MRGRNHGAINVVLTDVVMPGMSGPQLVERLREDQPQLAALFMSGYTSDAVLRHGIETGEADFLQAVQYVGLATKLRSRSARSTISRRRSRRMRGQP